MAGSAFAAVVQAYDFDAGFEAARPRLLEDHTEVALLHAWFAACDGLRRTVTACDGLRETLFPTLAGKPAGPFSGRPPAAA